MWVFEAICARWGLSVELQANVEAVYVPAQPQQS